jgi:hypothetical protein
MCRSVLAVVLALASGVAAAESADGPQSAGCREALASLQARESALRRERQPGRPSSDPLVRTPDAQLDALRRRAARSCLGGSGDPPPPTRSAVPPVSVGPPAGVSRPTAPLPVIPPEARAPLPKPAPAPTMIQGCDAQGCWASDGSRLLRMGPDLLGPRGLCTAQGALLVCP